MSDRKRDDSESAIAMFARACEELNQFAVAIREESRFVSVRTGADIRSHADGWKLEKWVECETSAEKGQWAVLWLELGADDSGWTVGSNLSISHGDYYSEFPLMHARTSDELQPSLATAVARLRRSLIDDREFCDAIERSRRA